MMIFCEFAWGSVDYKAELRLREEVLRRPLGLTLTAGDCRGEEDQRHFGLFQENGELVACVLSVKFSETETKLRQMAVAETSRGRGLGRELLGQVEKLLAGERILIVVLHARLSAVEFYQKLGYHTLGEEFTEVGLPHFKMQKLLGG